MLLCGDYLRNGFRVVKGGKGSHRKFQHDLVAGSYLLSGQDGDDASFYQERDLRAALRALRDARK